jgi:hypothetical protein
MFKQQSMKAQTGRNYNGPWIQISREYEWKVLCYGRFSSITHLMMGWVGPKAGLNMVAKNQPPPLPEIEH